MLEEAGSWLITDTYRTTVDRAIRARGCRVSVLRLFGDVDLTTHTAFESGLDRVLSDDPDRIVVDCSAMTFCGARGLGALMATVAAGGERGTDVAVVGCSALLHRLCAQLWPGPQPTSYPSVTDAISGAAHRVGELPAMTVPSAMPA